MQNVKFINYLNISNIARLIKMESMESLENAYMNKDVKEDVVIEVMNRLIEASS